MPEPRIPGIPAPTNSEDLLPSVRALIEVVKILQRQVAELTARVTRLGG